METDFFETSVMTDVYRTFGMPTLRVETSDFSELSQTTYARNLWYAKIEVADIGFLRNVLATYVYAIHGTPTLNVEEVDFSETSPTT